MVNKLTKSKISFSEILKNVDELITKFSTLNFIVRDIDIQKELIKEIQTYLSFIKYCKTQAIERNDEQHANAFLGIQCLLNSAISSLKIWVHIKESYHYLAWNSLIDAHEYIDYALKTNHEHPLFNEIKQQLQKTEEIIFPNISMYNSPGIIFTGGDCSVCGKPLDTCEHIEEKIYCGVVCKRLNIKNIELHHVALVKNPKDRRCIFTEFEFEKGKISDYISLKFLRNLNPKDESSTATAVILKSTALDIF